MKTTETKTPIVRNAQFTISRNIIAAINGFQSKDGTRHALMGTHFECRPNSVTLIATDGRRMAIYHYSTTVNMPSMPADCALVRFTADTTDALKLFRNPKKQWTVDLSDDDKEVRFAEDGAAGSESAVMAANLLAKDFNFPFWRNVVPTTPRAPADCFHFNSDLMKEFTIAAKLLGRDPGIQLMSHEPNGNDAQPYSVWIDNPEFFGLIMPMRAYNSIQGPPDWCLPPKAQPAPQPASETPAASTPAPTA